MKNFRSRMRWLSIVIMVLGFIEWSSSRLVAIDLTKVVKKKENHPKIESVLEALAGKYTRSKMAAQDFARENKILLKDDLVTVILVPPWGKDASVIDQAALNLYGATVEATSRHLMRAKIPLSSLEKVADEVAGVSYIRRPWAPAPAGVTSEGVELTGASRYLDAGYEGQNTKVAIIDLGFSEWEYTQSQGELPSALITRDFTGEGLGTGLWHGTGVAQVVYDMAPQAQLYLVKIADEVDLENAKDYCIAEGVNIINHSWGWPNTNFTDGSGLVCEIANDARDHGILWVNAAGNAAHQHYQESFRDDDGDGWHEFASGVETNAVEVNSEADEIRICLTWDSWPETDQDYDLYLYDSELNVVASSTNLQTGTQPPTEEIRYTSPDPGTYYIAVHRNNASSRQRLKVFTFGLNLQYQTVAYSIWPPADAAGVVAVAAIDQANWQTGPQESYSSRGPTDDGRIKPDISGPDGVRIFGGYLGGHWGTSYAAPHVAGAASLILSAMPGLSSGQLQSYLESWAVDMGEAGKDNIYGSGRLRLLLVAANLEDVIVYPNPFMPEVGHTKVTFAALTEGATIRIFNIAGQLVKKQEVSWQYSWDWDVKNMNGEKLARGIYIWMVTNPAGERKTGKIAVIR
ncbi:MAG: S8 family peptidase [bacterium]